MYKVFIVLGPNLIPYLQHHKYYDVEKMCLLIKNSIRDACTPQHREIVFNTMSYRSSETVQRLGYFQSSVSYKKVQVMF